jgi:hypothetical protein
MPCGRIGVKGKSAGRDFKLTHYPLLVQSVKLRPSARDDAQDGPGGLEIFLSHLNDARESPAGKVVAIQRATDRYRRPRRRMSVSGKAHAPDGTAAVRHSE